MFMMAQQVSCYTLGVICRAAAERHFDVMQSVLFALFPLFPQLLYRWELMLFFSSGSSFNHLSVIHHFYADYRFGILGMLGSFGCWWSVIVLLIEVCNFGMRVVLP